MPVTPVKLGPGDLDLTLDEEGALPVDWGCKILGAIVEWEADEEDDATVLCGDVLPGSRSYTATMSGTAVQDLTEQTGIVAFTWANKGKVADFVYKPNNTANATVTGQLVINPLSVGGEEYGARMESEFEFSIVGEPALTWPAA